MEIQQSFETRIPSRLDRLPWQRFHTLLVLGLGITWLLDGLEITLMAAIAPILERPDVLGLTGAGIGFASSCYLLGAVIGALTFGHLTDRYGRRPFFFLTLSLYLVGVGLTATAWNIASIAAFRFITGTGIGGEYAAVNSAIDELIPARLRGRVALLVNGSFWLGAALGAAMARLVLDPHEVAANVGWRIGFMLGPLLGLVILYLRRFIPESPRWQMTHGRLLQAEATVESLEAAAFGTGNPQEKAEPVLRIYPGRRVGLGAAFHTIITEYRAHAVLSLGLMSAQAFAYNGVFFTYALVLNRYYQTSPEDAALFLLPLSLGNFCGPLVLGRFIDTIGRRRLITSCFVISGMLLIGNGWLFGRELLPLGGQLALWTAMFFFASTAASSAYLTAGELFPLEVRALAIAIFYSAGTAIGGVAGPWLFGHFTDSQSRSGLCLGYALAASLMFGAGVLELVLGVDAERKALEEIARPLSSRN